MDAERHEALERGVVALYEKLTPAERGAYILREAFDYAYRDIATVLRLEEANARQVVTRARLHLSSSRRQPAHAIDHKPLRESIVTAARHGDVGGLEDFLAEGA